MKPLRRTAPFSLLLLTLLLSASGCSIFGVHFKVHNPRRAGKFPERTEAVTLHHALSKYRTCYDVKTYHLNIAIDPVLKSLGGEVTIEALATTDIDTLQLDLDPRFELKKILLNDEACTFTRRFGAVFLKAPGGVKNGRRFRMVITYYGIPVVAARPPWDGGSVWSTDDFGNPWLGVSCETEGASIWWPCKDHASDEADSTWVDLTVPTGLTAVSNGRLLGSEDKGTTTTWKWFVSYPINTYNITYYVGKLVLVHDAYRSKVTGQTLDLNHYVLAWHAAKAREHFQQLKDHLDFYERRFGPYPWYRDGFKFVESPYEGMEHQTAIAYGNGFYNDPDNGFDYIILHETAHEWWGNSVTAADLGDGWLQEGFATYAEALYVEDTKGYDAYVEYLLNDRISIINRRPVVRPMDMRYFDYHDEDIYNKGAWVLHSLRYSIDNDTLFFDILKTFATENRCKLVTTKTFLDLVNRKTGKDYSAFFDQYLYGRFVPELEYSVEKGKLYYRWSDRAVGQFAMDQRVAGFGKKEDKIHVTKEVNAFDLGASEKYFSLPDNDYLVKIIRVKKLARKYRAGQPH